MTNTCARVIININDFIINKKTPIAQNFRSHQNKKPPIIILVLLFAKSVLLFICELWNHSVAK